MADLSLAASLNSRLHPIIKFCYLCEWIKATIKVLCPIGVNHLIIKVCPSGHRVTTMVHLVLVKDVLMVRVESILVVLLEFILETLEMHLL